jgi:hypothetical protein
MLVGLTLYLVLTRATQHGITVVRVAGAVLLFGGVLLIVR